jgi:signal transduction histidine kinase
MGANLELIIHNLLSVVSALTFIGIAFFTFLNNPKKTANIALSLAGLSASIFFISHVIGVNVTDPNLSRSVLMLNLVMFFISAFNVHAVLALVGKDKENKWFIVFIYATACIFSLFFILKPNLFLLPSVPKMYFPNYYNPGPANWARMIYMYFICAPYIVYLLAGAYRKAETPTKRNQYKYFILTMIISYAIVFTANLLVYNIPVDPLWAMSAGVLFAIPFFYGAVQYGLFNVQIIAKQAFWYSIIILGTDGLIAVLNYSNKWISEVIPGFPTWIIALFSVVLVVTVSVFVWRQLRESDILKYEFITTATHKFRTPLTQIRWASESILKAKTLKEVAKQVVYIQDADAKLVDLTNLLMQASGAAEYGTYKYHYERANITSLTHEVIFSLNSQISQKRTKVVDNVQANIHAFVDVSHLKFVIQVFIENAVIYTPAGGTVSVSLSNNGKDIIFSVKDDGIGITGDEENYLFSKFYRGERARLIDTDGMGIGLFISKTIITRLGGKIWAETKGMGKGSIFSFSLPVKKNI